MEGHTMWEDPNFLEAKCLIAPRALSLIADHKIRTFEFSLFRLSVEGLELRKIGSDHGILFLCHL